MPSVNYESDLDAALAIVRGSAKRNGTRPLVAAKRALEDVQSDPPGTFNRDRALAAYSEALHFLRTSSS